MATGIGGSFDSGACNPVERATVLSAVLYESSDRGCYIEALIPDL